MNRRLMLCLAALCLIAAGPLKVVPLSPSISRTLHQPIAPTAVPTIKGFQPVGCLQPGKPLKVWGIGFGASTGKTLTLADSKSGSQVRVDFLITSWSDTQITALLPADPHLSPHEHYRLGIQSAQRNWIGQPDESVKICMPAPTSKAPKITAPLAHTPVKPVIQPPPTIHTLPTVQPPPKVQEQPKPQGETPAVPSAGDEGASQSWGEPYDGEYEYEYDYNYDEPYPENPPETAPYPDQGSYGSLMNSALPEPPALLPLVEKEDESIEPGELMVYNSSMAEARQLARDLSQDDLRVKRRQKLPQLKLVVSVFGLPKDQTVRDALKRIQKRFPKLWIDANHRYRPLGRAAENHRTVLKMVGADPKIDSRGRGVRIGLVDSGVAMNHPALTGRAVVQRSLLSAGVQAADAGHGTAIAALLIGNPSLPDYRGLVPAAELYAASVLRLRDKKVVDTSAELILRALDWLLEQRVKVINLSLGGPDNRLLRLAVRRVHASGVTLVAAAGEKREGRKPLFPAALPEVIAVTAVDQENRPYRDALPGDYIDFAAPGVDVWVASPPDAGAYRSGTSYAASFVTAAVAALGSDRSKPIDGELRKNAVDLGPAGRDQTYGWGLIRMIK